MNEQETLKEALSFAIEGKYDEAIAKGGIVLEGLQKLVKRATPMKPIYYPYGGWQCPSCKGLSVRSFTSDGNESNLNYCNDCGQALDWSDVK